MSNIPIIERSQNYVLNRKLLYIDSNSRDIEKYKNHNKFTIQCPQTYTNVESIRMLYIQTASNLYNISNYLQNNKISINNTDIEIPDGFYDAEFLTKTIQYELHKYENHSHIEVSYCSVINKIFFYSQSHNITIDCTKDNFEYINSKCTNYKIYNQHSDWGLGAILGFDKKIYNSTQQTIYLPSKDIEKTGLIIIPDFVSNINNNQHIYLSINKLNRSDTIEPYIYNINNKSNGQINKYFGQIPLLKTNTNQNCYKDDCYLNNSSYFQPPLDRLDKLEISFHYHNGMLVDFNNQHIVFTLEINQIRDEIKDYKVRTPFKL
jgi:hypothetical protein